jgi:hypothetical protein
MIVELTPEEAKVVQHALTEERDRVKRGDGNQYGPLPLKDMDQLIKKFE